MFFSISHNEDANFNCHWTHNSVTVNTDSGWTQTQLGDKFIVYKGYAESGQLTELLPTILNQYVPTLLGNFCVIVVDHLTVQIKTDRYRGFPLWVEPTKEITNLVPLSNTVWSNSILESDLQLNITQRKFNVIGNLDSTELSEDEVINQIDAILVKRTADFVKHNTLPIKSFLSGGVDTLLVYSYLKRVDASVNVIEYLHVDYDHFWRSNSHHLKKFWAYNQIHHWATPTVLASGAPGDEFMLRSPTTATMYLHSQNHDIRELLKNNPTCFHHDHFLKPKNKQLIDRFYHATYAERTIWDICNNLVNDWQHWHIGNTLTWTLLRDIEITKLLLRLPLESAIGQVLDSTLSKKLIERNIPGATKWLSNQKNIEPARKNLGRRLETRNAF
jgi:asparagine synthetase B (glutamine-hydrolysing)